MDGCDGPGVPASWNKCLPRRVGLLLPFADPQSFAISNRVLNATFVCALLIALTAAVFLIAGWRPAIAPRDTAIIFQPSQVRKGAELAAIGNCRACHTAEADKPYAGGRALPTPFGKIYASNITPDVDTGIGSWPEAAFKRAMRKGVGLDGRHLYPAFPYPHYALVSEEDLDALYAFCMTRPSIRNDIPKNELPFPLNVRALIFGWKLLFFHPRELRRASEHNDTSRGAYLVGGLGHCGDCHSPRNRFGAEDFTRSFSGGTTAGWDAPALDANSPAPHRWTAGELYEYLRFGNDGSHGTALGPMAEVSAALAHASDNDVRAIANYLASLRGPASVASAPHTDTDTPNELGALIYKSACAQCHVAHQPPAAPRGLDLSLSTVMNMPEPRNAIHVVRDGIAAPDGAPGAYMPPFKDILTDAQIAQVLDYARSRYSSRPRWSNLAQ